MKNIKNLDLGVILEEKVLDFLEEQIPEIAQAAVTKAYWQSLAIGHKVLEVENNCLIETSPDGTKRIIEELPPRIKLDKNKKIIIK